MIGNMLNDLAEAIRRWTGKKALARLMSSLCRSRFREGTTGGGGKAGSFALLNKWLCLILKLAPSQRISANSRACRSVAGNSVWRLWLTWSSLWMTRCSVAVWMSVKHSSTALGAIFIWKNITIRSIIRACVGAASIVFLENTHHMSGKHHLYQHEKHMHSHSMDCQCTEVNSGGLAPPTLKSSS